MEGFHIDDPKIKERIICQNSFAFSFVNSMPIVPGHVLICPVRIVKRSEELTSDEWKAILEMKKLVCDSLEKVFNAEGFNFAWNEGEAAGQTVSHFHLHIVPRKKGDQGIYEYEPRSFLYRPETRSKAPLEELIEVAHLIKQKLNQM